MNQLIKNNERDHVLKLASEIEEVHDVFIDMAMLVDSQGESIENIQTSIENTNKEVIGAKTQLIKAKKYQYKTRKCCFRIIFIGCIMISILIIILLVSIPSSTK